MPYDDFRSWFDKSLKHVKPSWFPLADRPLRKLRAMSEDPRIQELEKKKEEVKQLKAATEAMQAELRKYQEATFEKAATLPKETDSAASDIMDIGYGVPRYFINPDGQSIIQKPEVLQKMQELLAVYQVLTSTPKTKETESTRSVAEMRDKVVRFIEGIRDWHGSQYQY